MSSHHIVREKQEPALLVLGLTDFDTDWLGQLLEWSPTVIATAGTVLQLMEQAIHIDWLLTKEDVNPTTQADIQIVPSAPHMWLTNALHELIAKEYPAVNIITDDLSPEDYLPYLNKINLVIYHQQQKIYAVKPGFEKWKPAGTVIKLLNQPVELECNNLATVGNGVYEVQADGFIKLCFKQDFVLVAEQL